MSEQLRDGSAGSALARLVDECLQRYEEEGAKALEELCLENPQEADHLRRRVGLLERAGLLGARTSPEDATPAGAASSAPEELGDFRLLRLLGRGGMGEVWEAEQRSLGRRVALKILLPGRMSERAVDFFAREARAGGRLSHPGIVSVYGAGEDEGIAWIAMELVEGDCTLASFLEDARSEKQLPEGYYRAAAKLISKVAFALDAAHAAGVIHRDLKPSNVLITPEDEPIVADFGLARLVDEHSLSQTGELAGTYYYMSPEQVAARRMGIDHRTDVFSLGVVLYELLSLRRPFEGDTSHQIAAQILTRDPPDPRVIRSRVPNDLAVIAGKCLEKDRERRYESMVELGADLERHLADEPILARPPGLLERGRKWMRRNPTRSAVALVAAAAFVVIAWLGLEARASAREAELQRAAAETARVQAEQQRAEALTAREEAQRSAAEALRQQELAQESADEAGWQRDVAARQRDLAQAVNDFLNDDLLAAVMPSQEAGRGKDVPMRAVLDAAAEKIEGRFAGKPEVEARIRYTLGRTYQGLGEFERAVPHLVRGLALTEKVMGEDDVATLEAMNGLGMLLAEMGQLTQAEQLLDRALEARRRTLGERDARTLTSMSNLALLRLRQGKAALALPLLRSSLEGHREVLGTDDPSSLAVLGNLASALSALGEYSEAEALTREALEATRRVLGEEHHETAGAMQNLAVVLSYQARYVEAEQIYREALEIRRRVLGEEHPTTLGGLGSLALCLKNQGRYAEAEPYYVEVLAARRRILGDDHPDTLLSIDHMAGLMRIQGNYAEAERFYREALERSRRSLGGDHPDTLIGIDNLASLLQSQGRLEEAETYFRESLAGMRRVLGGDHPSTLISILNMGGLLRAQGLIEQVEPYWSESLAGFRRVFGPDHPTTLHSLQLMGVLRMDLGQLQEADPLLVEALAGLGLALGEQHRRTLGCLQHLARLRLLQGRQTEAEELGHKLVRLASESDPNYATIEALLEEILRAGSGGGGSAPSPDGGD